MPGRNGSWNGYQGWCSGSWQGPGRAGTLCFRELLPLPGVFLLELQEAEGTGTGAVAAATPWDGAIGDGKVTVALAAAGQGQGKLTSKEGGGVGLSRAAGSVTQLAVSLSSVWPSPAGTPSRLPGSGCGCSRLPGACGSHWLLLPAAGRRSRGGGQCPPSCVRP